MGDYGLGSLLEIVGWQRVLLGRDERREEQQMRRAVARTSATSAAVRGSIEAGLGGRLIKCMTMGALHHRIRNGAA